MEKLQVFSSPDFGNVRAIEIDGQPWFVGKDVATILGYTNPSKALSDHVDDEDKLNNESLLSLGQRGGWLINEPGLYSLVLSSKLPSAKQFKKWITHDVIPSLRKYGAYIVDQEHMTREEFLARAVLAADAMIEEKNQQIRALEYVNKQLAPKGEYYDNLVDTKLNTNFRDTAKELGIGQKEFIQWLLDNKYIYRDAAGNIRPYAKYANTGKGYFELKEWSNGSISGVRTLITPKGKQEFMDRMKNEVSVQ